MKRAHWIGITATIIACMLIATFITHYQSKQHDKQFTEERQKVQSLLDERLTDSEQKLTPHEHNHLDHPSDHPPHHTTEKPTYKDSNASMESSNGQWVRYYPPGEINIHTYRYKDGMYKGLTHFEACIAWQTKVREARDTWLASIDTSSEISKAMIDSTNAKLSTILTVFKTLSPDELEFAKSVTLKDYPNKADEIESFFNDVANHSTTKSLDEIAKDHQFILESDKAIWTAEEKNRKEIDKNYAKLQQAQKEKPDREEAIKLAEIANKQQGNTE